MKRQNKIRLFLSYIAIIVTMACGMVLLIWAAYSIPAEKIRENAAESADIMSVTYDNIVFPVKFSGAYLDINTDSRMLNMASFLGEKGALQDSLLNPRAHYFLYPYVSLAIAAKKNSLDGADIRYYPRFWQGWLIFLKPLMVLFDLWQIRILNLFLQIGLISLILLKLYRKFGSLYCVAFLSAIAFLNPVNSWKCLEFVTDVNIMLLAAFWVLLNKKTNDKYMFFIIGAVTNLFDWLTYPLITLGVPLIIYVCLSDKDLKLCARDVIKQAFLWCWGYTLMWGSKWAAVFLLTDYDIFSDVRGAIVHSSYGIVEGDHLPASEIIYKNALLYNFSELFFAGNLIYLAVFVFSVAMGYYVNAYRWNINFKIIILFGIALLPFVWYGVLVNHSVHHPWMTHKILVITIYAILSAVVCCLKPRMKLKAKIK